MHHLTRSIEHWRHDHFNPHGKALEALEALSKCVQIERCLPEPTAIFRAFEQLTPAQVRVVLLGQDPYPNAADAMGLAFSSPAPKLPASLRNIFKELAVDLNQPPPPSGDLSHWVAQGVLLANTALTIGQDGQSHFSYWSAFTRSWVLALSASHPIVWLLWGKHAQSWKTTITESGQSTGVAHIIIESPHPSPLSAHRGFFGSRPFSKTNAALRRLGHEEIIW